MKNHRNTWSMKNPRLNISKDEIRQTIAVIGKKYGFGYIFGTPVDWDFEGPVVPVTIANMNTKTMFDDNFKPFIEEVVAKYRKISAKRITYSLGTKSESYQDEKMFHPIEYSQPLLTLTFHELQKH